MTKLMARAFCAFNALVFLCSAIACGLLLAGVLDPALAAAGLGGVTALCGMVNATAAFFISHARTRVSAVEATEAKPTADVVSMGAKAMAQKRWGT